MMMIVCTRASYHLPRDPDLVFRDGSSPKDCKAAQTGAEDEEDRRSLLPTSCRAMIIPLHYNHTTGGEKCANWVESQALPKSAKIWLPLKFKGAVS